MTQSLLTGVSGMLAHQRKLDVVANNLANLNTTGYKAQNVLFSDVLYRTLQPASGPANSNAGGTNPQQIGFGVQIGQISRNFTQGVLTSTGEAFDFAVQGDGFFVVSGEEQAFTRDGAFTLDRNGFLVVPSSGALVQRFGTVGEGSDTEQRFQTPGNSGIFVPIGASVPGQQTANTDFLGNLPTSAVPPLAEVLTTSSPLTAGSSPAQLTTLLNDLDSNLADYQVGDTIEIVGTNVDGSSFSASLPAGPATAIGDLIDAVNAEVVGATMSLSATGNLVLTADETGDALLSINIADNATNIGETNFSNHAFTIQTDGKEGDIFELTLEIFDLRGEPHSIQAAFQKQTPNIWDATFSSGDEAITMVDDLVESIIFNEDGTFQTVDGVGDGDANIQLSITNIGEEQTIDISLANLTHMATNFSTTAVQDGYPPGNIVSVNVSSDGILQGSATNGRSVPIAQLAIATFINDKGLEGVGQNQYVETSNSGDAQIGVAQAGASGSIRSGQLETSNVDVALEFTQLIVAQRGFSANARTITVASEVLEELTNIIR
jgi:flagellar hook protein FlgE